MDYRQSRFDWAEYGFDFVFQLLLVAGVFYLGGWIWPEGMLKTPIAKIALGDWLQSLAAIVVYGLGLVMAYFVLVEPVRAFTKGIRAA